MKSNNCHSVIFQSQIHGIATYHQYSDIQLDLYFATLGEFYGKRVISQKALHQYNIAHYKMMGDYFYG